MYSFEGRRLFMVATITWILGRWLRWTKQVWHQNVAYVEFDRNCGRCKRMVVCIAQLLMSKSEFDLGG